MNNIHLTVLGSATFSNILNELEFHNILNPKIISNHSYKKILIKILFVENLKIKAVKNYLLKNEPIILFLNHKDYTKKNNLKLLDFHASLELPIEILSFKEILNILITKYNFFKKSKIVINDYEIDSNERSITKKRVKAKLTEKELELILALNNNNNGLNKSYLLKSIWKHSLDLETHAFETHLHRLRKKINKYFNDKNFIVEKNSLYYLTN
jgi:DNA-binding response OmpR family regulator